MCAEMLSDGEQVYDLGEQDATFPRAYGTLIEDASLLKDCRAIDVGKHIPIRVFIFLRIRHDGGSCSLPRISRKRTGDACCAVVCMLENYGRREAVLSSVSAMHNGVGFGSTVRSNFVSTAGNTAIDRILFIATTYIYCIGVLELLHLDTK